MCDVFKHIQYKCPKHFDLRRVIIVYRSIKLLFSPIHILTSYDLHEIPNWCFLCHNNNLTSQINKMWNWYYSTAGILIAWSVLPYENDVCEIWILKFDVRVRLGFFLRGIWLHSSRCNEIISAFHIRINIFSN